MSQFYKEAIAAGFSPEQAKLLDQRLAKYPHEHEIEDIVGLEDALEGNEEEEDDEED